VRLLGSSSGREGDTVQMVCSGIKCVPNRGSTGLAKLVSGEIVSTLFIILGEVLGLRYSGPGPAIAAVDLCVGSGPVSIWGCLESVLSSGKGCHAVITSHTQYHASICLHACLPTSQCGTHDVLYLECFIPSATANMIVSW